MTAWDIRGALKAIAEIELMQKALQRPQVISAVVAGLGSGLFAAVMFGIGMFVGAHAAQPPASSPVIVTITDSSGNQVMVLGTLLGASPQVASSESKCTYAPAPAGTKVR